MPLWAAGQRVTRKRGQRPIRGANRSRCKCGREQGVQRPETANYRAVQRAFIGRKIQGLAVMVVVATRRPRSWRTWWMVSSAGNPSGTPESATG